MASGSNSRGLVLLLITSCFFITGILFDYMPMIIDDHIKRTIELATNEEILSIWGKPPVDVNTYIWIYEIVNADGFQREGQKAQVRQLGPFHFISRLEKRIVSLSANKFRLTYNSTRLMSLNESSSRHDLDRPITAPNPYYAAILEGVRLNSGELDGQSRALAYGTISKLTERHNESILDRNTTARRLLLGRPMPIIAKLARMADTLGMGSRMPEVPASASPEEMPPPPDPNQTGGGGGGHRASSPAPVYGYVKVQNNTLSGPFEIYTGYQETARSLGEIISYKGKRRLNYYDGKCNRLQASAGELRPMPVDPERRLEMFSPMLCRIIRFEPTGQQKLREGWAISYTMLADDFASAATNPDNRCFCTNSSGPGAPIDNTNPLDDNHCSLDGVIDLGPCSYGAPLLMAPSSLQLDSRIVNSLGNEFDPELLQGEMNELDQADDKSQMVVLKRVGVPIRADITMTVFLRLVRDTAFKETATIPDVSYLPLVTIRESVTIPPKLAQIIINLESFISLTYHIKVVMYLSAVVLLFWLSGHYYGMSSDGAGAAVGPNSDSDADGQQQQQQQQQHQRNRRQTDPQQQRRPSTQMGAGGETRGAPGGGRPDSGGQPSPSGQEAAGNEQADTAPSAACDGPAERAGPSQRRSSSLLNGANQGGRALETVEEVAMKRTGSSAAQAGTAVAKPLDMNSNDRANSADSSRSLPPSRHASRLGSLSEVSSGQLEAGANAASAATTSGAGSATNDTGRSQSGASIKGQPAARQTTRIFSKVDERLETTAAAASARPGSDEANLTTATPNGAPAPDEPGQEGKPSDEPKLTERPNGGGGQQPARRRRRKNWFMNVYSNLVQMLNGLRGSINEAGQLELRPDSDLYQDKRLEMLAGKIDNWYNLNGDEQHQTGSAARAVANPPIASGRTAAAAAGRFSVPNNMSRNSFATKTTSILSAAATAAATGEAGRTGRGEMATPEAGTPEEAGRAQTEMPANRAIDSAETPALSGRPSSGSAADERPQPQPSSRSGPLETSARSNPTGIEGAETQAAADFPTERQFVSDSGALATTTTTTTTGAATSVTTRANECPISSSSPSQVSLKQTAATVAAAANGVEGGPSAEANPTERNGLNSRSMREESARPIEAAAERSSAATTVVEAAPGDEGRAARATPPPSGQAPNSRPPSDGRRKRELAERDRDGGNQSSGPQREPAPEVAPGQPLPPQELLSAGNTNNVISATDEETETEPETELEAENESAASELDKAKTLEKIEAALDGSDEEFARQLHLKTNGVPKHRQSAPEINSSQLSQVDSLKRPAPIDNEIKVLHQSKAPVSGGDDDGNDEDEHDEARRRQAQSGAAGQLAIDGLNPTDRLRQSKGPLANGPARGAKINGQIRENMTNSSSNNNNNSSKRALDGTNSKLVDELRGDELDFGHAVDTGLKLEAELRIENSSNALVPNMSPKSSGRPQATQPESRLDKMGKLIKNEIFLELSDGNRRQSAQLELSSLKWLAPDNGQFEPDGGRVGWRVLAESNQTIERREQINHENKLRHCSDRMTRYYHEQEISPLRSKRIQLPTSGGNNPTSASIEWDGNNRFNEKMNETISLRRGLASEASGQIGACRLVTGAWHRAAGSQATSLKQAGALQQSGWVIEPAGA